MEDARYWEDQDPLLITDVRRQQQKLETRSHPPSVSFQISTAADPDDLCLNKIEEISLQNRSREPEVIRVKDCMDPMGNDVLDEISWSNPSSEAVEAENVIHPLADNVLDESSWRNPNTEASGAKVVTKPIAIDVHDGHSVLGLSLTSPDLVTCSGSPDIPKRTYQDSPELSKRSSIELSFENGITEGSEMNPSDSKVLKSSSEDLDSSEASFELIPLAQYEENVNYEIQKEELMEAKRAVEMVKRENECKSKECEEALKSLRELQNELMRKSMHVGSLAFAVEGQVKEKSRWFSSLRDMSRKLKIMKMDQIKLLEEAEACKKYADDMNNISCIIQSRIEEQVKQHENLQIRFNEGARERKELYNKIQELKGNIRVFCRCRPLNSEEIDEGASMAFDFDASKDGELRVKSNIAFRKNFKFDAVFSPQANQVDVFEDTAPFATSVLDGYNVCIFAYGQTGTGKTFTMEGTYEARGVNFRTLEELFRVIDERKNQLRYEISVSVLEVYNEQIRDLLLPSSQPGAATKRLEIRQVGEGLHHVPGLVEAQVNNMNEVWEVLRTGSNARAVGSTNANEHSSRSHCIHCVMVKGENLVSGECTRSKLWLVDLAGSERVAKTEVQGERLKETQNINRSLSALGDVISALATKSPHIPFRNSKLTHLLQDSLGGDSKTLMFVQISPNENDLSESLCSLNFASRARGVELGPAKKQIESSEVTKYKQMAEKYKHEMKNKELQIKMMEDNFHGLDMKLKVKELKYKNLQDKVKELESQLLVERKLARQHIDTKIAEQQEMQQMRQQHQDEPNSLSRPPLAEKDTCNFPAPLQPPSKDLGDSMEKENNPSLAEQLRIPKRTGRASLCTTSQRVPVRSVQRRNTLIPLPTTTPVSTKFTPHMLPLPPIQAENENENEGSMGPMPAESPKGNNSGGKKLISALRRSLHMKNLMKSPMQQQQPQQTRRNGGVNVERVRVSIGSRGRMAHRVLGNGRRAKQQNYTEKERRWNIGK